MRWSIDQTRFSLASLEGDWNGATLRAIQKLTVTDELQSDSVYGNSSVAIGDPVGTHKAEGNLTTIPEEFDGLVQTLGDEFGRVLGSIGITLYEPSGAGIYTVNITRVKLMKIEADFGEAGGQKASTKAVNFKVLDPVDWNGLSIIRDKGISLGLNISFGPLSISI